MFDPLIALLGVVSNTFLFEGEPLHMLRDTLLLTVPEIGAWA